MDVNSSKEVTTRGQKEDELIVVDNNLLVGSGTTELMVPKAKIKKSGEERDAAYAATIQESYFYNLRKQEIQREKSETEVCFRDIEAEILKAENEVATIKQLLMELPSLRKCDSKIEQLENVYEEGDIYQLQALLKTINQIMKIANGRVPLTAVKVTDASRDDFLSKIQKLSDIRNEIISIMKPYEANQKYAAQNVEAIASTVMQLRNLIKDLCSVQTYVVSRAIKALSLESCLVHQEQDSQLTLDRFKLNFDGPSCGSNL